VSQTVMLHPLLLHLNLSSILPLTLSNYVKIECGNKRIRMAVIVDSIFQENKFTS
jgi:hypothetical protein